MIVLLLTFATVGCSWVDCFPFSPRSSPDFYIEVDKRAMLTTGQENTSPPSPSRPRIALKIGNSSSSPPTLTLTLLLPSRDIRDGEGLLEGMLDLPVDKTVDGEQDGEWCSILNQIVLTSGLDRTPPIGQGWRRSL